MDAELKKKIDSVKPRRSTKKRYYEQPLRVLERGADRNPRGRHIAKSDGRFPKCSTREAEQLFFSIRWDEAWQQFLKRKSDGKFKHKTAHDLAAALAVGIDAKTRRRRAGYLYSAIGPVSAADKKKLVPYLGDWDMLRAQTFLGEMQHDNMLFGSPRMKVMREALREHIDVTQTAKGMAEVLLGWLARCERWARQIDHYFDYKVFDDKLSLKQNKQRFAEYTRLQESLRMSTVSTIEQILNCYGVGRGGMDVLAQLMVASKLQGQANSHAYETILAGLTGVETLDGKATGGVEASSEDPSKDPSNNWTLKLLTASLADKAITYKMPHPELNIPGVPDEDKQETPREHIKRVVRGMMLEPKKIQ